MNFKKHTLFLVASGSLLLAACIADGFGEDMGPGPQHGWWDGLGPVIPHDTFPANCDLCHAGNEWQSVKPEFEFDHERETGVALLGSHEDAKCLRCHNDRGPVETFAAQGCAGCHEDIHFGRLGRSCEECHTEQTWQPFGQVALHNRTRFPLVGVHASTSCRRCHIGAEVGQFVPTDVECIACHQPDLQLAVAPNHVTLGWIDRCDRCHIPTTWNQAEISE